MYEIPLLHEMQVALAKWKKQMHLLDRETAAIIDALEDVVLKRAPTKRKVNDTTQHRKAGKRFGGNATY